LLGDPKKKNGYELLQEYNILWQVYAYAFQELEDLLKPILAQFNKAYYD
jgi:hypothetical protein